jgi:ribosomal protein S17E
MSYGYCPICGAKGKSRERRINGDDRCENDHVYPSSTALKTPPKNDSQISMEQKILQLQEEIKNLESKLAKERSYVIAYLREKAALTDVDEIQTTEALNIIAGYIERGEHFLRDDENG